MLDVLLEEIAREEGALGLLAVYVMGGGALLRVVARRPSAPLERPRRRWWMR